MSVILSGNEIKKQILVELKDEVDHLIEKNIKPSLSVILAGGDPASEIYVSSKIRTCQEIGIQSVARKLPQSVSQQELLEVVGELNRDPSVHGILCQVPLPEQCQEEEVLEAIDPLKDVDCFHPFNVGLLATGNPRFMPCTPYGILQILKRSGILTKGKNVVVLGRSNIVGRPLSILISQKGWDATVTLCHSKTENIEEVCSRADILIAAIGISKFIKREHVKKDAVIIDVGMNRIIDPTHPKGKRLTGDVDFEAVKDKVSAITPVPGGVGPMTIAMLMLNTINAARISNDLPLFQL